LVAILPRSRSTHVPNDANMEDEGGSGYSGLREEHVVKASALLRLYCALMGIAGLRPTDEEAEQLLQLMTSRPPATPAGVRFVSLSFCKLLAFPTLVRYTKLYFYHWFRCSLFLMLCNTYCMLIV
ncbi:Integrator complex subunit 2, partial [Goodea atripinnis]